MTYTIYFQLLTNGCIQVNAPSLEDAQVLVENMSDKKLLDECNPLLIEFTDEDGFSLD